MSSSKRYHVHTIFLLFYIHGVLSVGNFLFYNPPIQCDEEYKPSYCGFPNVSLSNMLTVEDFDNCAPGMLPLEARNYYIGTSGKAITYQRNLEAYKNIPIRRRVLRDVSNIDLTTTLLGHKVSFPVGIAPTAAHTLANPEGELATARASAKSGTVMILSSLSTKSVEDVSNAASRYRGPDGQPLILWLQLYLLTNRQESYDIIKRAERSNCKAIVVTCDVPKFASRNCESETIMEKLTFPNLYGGKILLSQLDASLTFEDLLWVKQNTRLPVVAKGIITGADAVLAAEYGASAVVVSNHGGRQLDSDQATIEALPEVVESLRFAYPHVEVYVDGGVRNGFSVFKALARGARAVFVGRPALWGLTIAGQEGVEKVLSILKKELNETMLLSGHANVKDIYESTIDANQRTPPISYSLAISPSWTYK